MSQILQTVYASAPSNQIPIHTLTLEAPSLPDGVLRWVQGSEDESMGLENNGGTVLYKALPFGVSLPDKSLRGNQDLQFQLDNITGEALQHLNKALDAGDKIKVVYRVYLDSDKSAPAEQPIVMTATSMSADYKSVQVIADFHDFLNKAWPSLRYTAEFAPGLKYLQLIPMNTETYLAVPYVDGSRDIAVGLDCWGMVRHVLHQEFGFPLLESFGGINRNVPVLMTKGFEQSSPDFQECAPKAGAVACCFYRGNDMDVFHHVGVCISDADVLHTSSNKGPYVSSIRAFKRLAYVVKFFEYVGKK